MTTTPHKTIWRITVACVAIAGIVTLLRGEKAEAPLILPTSKEAFAIRDNQIAELNTLLASDWRMRRIPTRIAVEHVSAYAQHPTLATAESFYALALFRFYAEKNTVSARNALDQAIALDPEWSWPYCLLGVIQYTQGDTVQGLKSLHQAMELDPGWSRPYSDLAILYRIDENWAVALDYAQTAIDLDSKNPIPYYNYGVIMDYKGDHDAAVVFYERVLEMNAELPAPYYNIACGFARHSDVTETLRYLEIAVRLDPAFHFEANRDPDFDTIRNKEIFIEFMDAHAP